MVEEQDATWLTWTQGGRLRVRLPTPDQQLLVLGHRCLLLWKLLHGNHFSFRFHSDEPVVSRVPWRLSDRTHTLCPPPTLTLPVPSLLSPCPNGAHSLMFTLRPPLKMRRDECVRRVIIVTVP